jgi:aminoglycoside phosphotransferase (APT) family kinase protein
MTIAPRPPAEVAIDDALVRALLAEQHRDLAHLPLVEVDEGWDNKLFRLGDDLVVRVPRRASSAALIEHEQRWLPVLSQRLPLSVPVPQRVGRASPLFPWPWSVTAWFSGQTALVTPLQNSTAAAVALGQFLSALHQPAPDAAPRNPWRGVPLAARETSFRQYLEQAKGLVAGADVLDLWERALSTPAWTGPATWIHGDLHPGNLIVDRDRLSAVIDFSDLAAGDPAVDLSVAWILLPTRVRSIFRACARDRLAPVDDDTWMRARGWALALGLAYLANSRQDESLGALGKTTIDAALRDGA